MLMWCFYMNNIILSYVLNFRLKIEAKTWVRDSHGLFDYESSQLNI